MFAAAGLELERAPRILVDAKKKNSFKTSPGVLHIYIPLGFLSSGKSVFFSAQVG